MRRVQQFHARYPFFRYPLDPAFHSAHFTLVDLEVLPYVDSDHFPVYVELAYDPEAPDEHAEPTAHATAEAQVQHEVEKRHRTPGTSSFPTDLTTPDSS